MKAKKMQQILVTGGAGHLGCLGEGTFDSGTQGVGLAKRGSQLKLSLLLQGFMSRLRTHTQHPPGGL